jgi:lipopolysaccharide export system permease protein
VKLAAHILTVVMTRILGAAFILLSILQVLDLLDVTTDILDRGLGVAGVFHHAALRFPRLLEQVAPLSVLAGGLFAFGQLARENAVVAMRASGVSVYRLVRMALPAALVVMVVDYAAIELVAPRTDAALAAWWRDTAPKAEAAPKPHPFRSGDDLVVARAGDPTGARLADVTIYRRDEAGRLVERIEAPAAVYAKRTWRLQSPKIVRFTQDAAMTSAAAEMVWPTRLKPADVRTLLFPDQAPSAATARRALEGGGSERPESYYATRVYRAWAEPVGAIIMLLLAAPVALGNFRNREGAVLTVASLAAGLTFLVMDGLLTALGESAAVTPALAAWAAPLVFGLLASTALIRMEG